MSKQETRPSPTKSEQTQMDSTDEYYDDYKLRQLLSFLEKIRGTEILSLDVWNLGQDVNEKEEKEDKYERRTEIKETPKRRRHKKGTKKKERKIFRKLKAFFRCYSGWMNLIESIFWILFPPLPSEIIRKAMFFAPKPSTYCFVRKSDKTLVNPNEVNKPDRNYDIYYRFKRVWSTMKTTEYFYTPNCYGNLIACAYVKSIHAPRFNILLSHANAVDLGHSLSGYQSLQTIANYLKCNILSYDYSGYGMSQGKATEDNIYADIRAAYDCLIERFNSHNKQIIVHGCSLGTAASIHLASQINNFAGLILTGPFTSAIRIVFEQKNHHKSWCFDQFKSIEKISKVRAPTLICHGKKDEIVPFSHAQMLCNKCPKAVKPCFLNEASHNDIYNYNEYWKNIYKFIKTLAARRSMKKVRRKMKLR